MGKRGTVDIEQTTFYPVYVLEILLFSFIEFIYVPSTRSMVKIDVNNEDDLEDAIRKFNRKCNHAGVFREIKRNSYYEKPSEKRRQEKKRRKQVIKKAKREMKRRRSKNNY